MQVPIDDPQYLHEFRYKNACRRNDVMEPCFHRNKRQINNTTAICLDCGVDVISVIETKRMKTMKDFERENPIDEEYFNRNFTNEVNYGDPELTTEYYVDKNGIFFIMIDKSFQLLSNPPQYNIRINGKQSTMTDNEINMFLRKITASPINKSKYDAIRRMHRRNK